MRIRRTKPRRMRIHWREPPLPGWLYGEQKLWTSGEKNILCMVQYSENSNRKNACYRYAEIGGAYLDAKNECGVSGQYAQFQQGDEYSLELTETTTHQGHSRAAFLPVHPQRRRQLHRAQRPPLSQLLTGSIPAYPLGQHQCAHHQEGIIKDSPTEHGGKDGNRCFGQIVGVIQAEHQLSHTTSSRRRTQDGNHPHHPLSAPGRSMFPWH